MRFNIFLSVVFIATLLLNFTRCASGPYKNDRLEQVADGYCECVATIAILDNHASALPDSSNALTGVLDSMQQAYDRAVECLAPLRAANNEIKPTEVAEIQRILQSKCPDLARNKELITELLCR